MTPSPFVVQWVPVVTAQSPRHPRALDVAVGGGRHVQCLAKAGYKVFGVDWSEARLREAAARARNQRTALIAWCADLTAFPLPRDYFDLVLVTRYLERTLFESLRATIKPGGVVLYETFTIGQRRHGTGPTSPDHLLEPGELRARFASFEVLFYEETAQPEAVARLVAKRND